MAGSETLSQALLRPLNLKASTCATAYFSADDQTTADKSDSAKQNAHDHDGDHQTGANAEAVEDARGEAVKDSQPVSLHAALPSNLQSVGPAVIKPSGVVACMNGWLLGAIMTALTMPTS